MIRQAEKNYPWLRKIGRALLWIPIFLVILFLLSFSILQIPNVQTNLLNKFSKYIAANTSFDITIEHANLTWYDKMLVEKITVRSQGNDSTTLLEINEVRINLNLSNLLFNRQITADELELESPRLYLTKESDSTDINVSLFIYQLKELFQKSENQKKISIEIENVYITNGRFSYNDLRKDEIKNGKDFYHFSWDHVEGHLNQFNYKNDSLWFNIGWLVGEDPQGQVDIQSMVGKFAYSKKRMSIYDFELKTAQSTIGDSITFEYDQPSAFKYFIDSVSFACRFSQSGLHLQELGLFAPVFKDYNVTVNFSGHASGKINRFSVSGFDLNMGKKTELKGNVSFIGLPRLKEAFIDLKLAQSILDPSDISIFISEKYREKAKNLPPTSLEGEFLGFISDFVTKAQFEFDSSIITTDINFKTDKHNRAKYEGAFSLSDFDLQQIFPEQTTIQKVSLNANIKGHGLRKNNAAFQLTGSIDSINVYGYTYTNLQANGRFEDKFFEGNLVVQDPNLAFFGDIEVDLRDGRDIIRVDAVLDSANLQLLNISQEDVRVSSIIDVDMKGLKLDEIRGYFNLYDNRIRYNGSQLIIDSIKFLSSKIGNRRFIHLETEGLTGTLNGEFNNSQLIKDLPILYQEILLSINNDHDQIENHYAEKAGKIVVPYQVDMEINLWNLNKFIQPFYPDFYLSKNVRIEGHFSQDSTTAFSIYTQFDSLSLDEIHFYQNEFSMDLARNHFDTKTLGSFRLVSEKQILPGLSHTANAYLDATWEDGLILFSTNIEQSKYDNQFNLEGQFTFLRDTVDLRFLPSSVRIFDKNWTWKDQNLIRIYDDKVHFESVALSSGKEKMKIEGVYGNTPKEVLNIFVGEFNMQNFNSFTSVDIEGILDGKIRVKNLHNQHLIESDLTARAFKIEDFLVGTIYCLSKWENAQKRLALQFDLVRNEEKKIDIEGFFYPTRNENQLALEARFDDANLKMAQPFLKKLLSNLTGFATGEFSVSGNLNSPVIHGNGSISSGRLTVNYLNTTYDFFGGIKFDENKISASGLELRDAEENRAYIVGGIIHNGFKDLVLDVHGTFEKFKLLNTTSIDNDAYYGTAFGTGEISFLGDIQNLQITAKAKSEKGTRLSIPIGELSGYKVEQKEYINFVNLKNPEYQKKKIQEAIGKSVKIKGVELDFDIEMTPDAYVELIFDVKAGDIIRGKGNGNITLDINTDGDFNMFGDYEIQEGGYNFTLYNIINKEFKIQKGSTISWFGDPYRAQLNIEAQYRQLASLAPILLLSEEDQNSPEVRKKYPSFVKLYLTGDLLSPDIKFDIDIEDYPRTISITSGPLDLEGMVTAFKSKLKSNEQEMNRQVFSLIILRKFSPENSFQVNSQTIGNSLSEFVSNQLSYWATQVDENLEIDVDLAGLDEEAFNTFQLRLSYTFLDGRLRISRGGGIPNEQIKDDLSAIIGDWTVEYLLTDDGRFRVKMYSRSDLNAVAQNLDGNNMEAGFSLQYIRSFDELKQVLSDSRAKNKNAEITQQASEGAGTK